MRIKSAVISYDDGTKKVLGAFADAEETLVNDRDGILNVYYLIQNDSSSYIADEKTGDESGIILAIDEIPDEIVGAEISDDIDVSDINIAIGDIESVSDRTAQIVRFIRHLSDELGCY